MMSRVRNQAFAVLACMAFVGGAAAPAVAEDGSSDGFYVSLSGLFVVPTDSEYSERASGGETFSANLSMESGIGFLGAVGHEISSGLRAELELGYRQADLDEFGGISVSGPGTSVPISVTLQADGDVGTLSLMANAVYGFEAWALRPYIGAGLGLARHVAEIDALTVSGVARVGLNDSGDDTVFAYQFMAGAGFPLSDKAEIRFGYRYFGTAAADFEGGGGTTEATYGTHNLEGGILYRF